MSTTSYQYEKLLTKKRSNLYPWFIWALASGFLFFKYLLQVSPSIIVDDLMHKFDLTAQSFGHLAAFYFYAYMLMQLPGGLLLDKVKLKVLLPVAILICTLGAYLFAVTEQLWVAQFGRVLIGLGGAFSATGTMKLISLYFPAKRFAFVSGLMMTCGMLGAVGGQAPLAYLSQQLGWESALYLCCAIGLGLATMMYAGLAAKPHNTNNTAKMTAPSLDASALLGHCRQLLKNRQCWFIGIFSGLAFAPISAFGGLWGVPFIAAKLSLTTTQAAFYISIIFIGFALGCPLSGYLSDKMGKRKPLMCAGTLLGCLALSCLLYLPISSLYTLTALMFAFGFFTSFFFISFAMIREINPILIGGTAIGFINTFDAIFGAFSEPSVGAILDWRWQGNLVNGVRHFSLADYQFALSLLPVAMIISLIIALLIKETHCKQFKG